MSTKRAVIAWTRLVRIQQKIDAASDDRFRALGLNTAWFDVLARVGAREGMTQGELAETLLVTKGNVSQLIAKLEAEGLICRVADGRKQHLYLTEQGRSLRTLAMPKQEAYLVETLRGLTDSEQQELIRLLRKWEEA